MPPARYRRFGRAVNGRPAWRWRRGALGGLVYRHFYRRGWWAASLDGGRLRCDAVGRTRAEAIARAERARRARRKVLGAAGLSTGALPCQFGFERPAAPVWAAARAGSRFGMSFPGAGPRAAAALLARIGRAARLAA